MPRRRTGSRRVRERFDAVEIPLNSTNQSQNARQRLLDSLIETLASSLAFDSLALGRVHGNEAKVNV